MKIVRLPLNSFDIQRWNHGIGFKNACFHHAENYKKDSNGFLHTETGLFRWKDYMITTVYSGMKYTWVILVKTKTNINAENC